MTIGTHRHTITNVEKWDYAFDPDKNTWLIRERGISFEQIIALIESGHLVQVLEHHDCERYPNQLLYEVDVGGKDAHHEEETRVGSRRRTADR